MINLQKLYLKLISKKGEKKEMIINEEKLLIREELESVEITEEVKEVEESKEVEITEEVKEVEESKEVETTEEVKEVEESEEAETDEEVEEVEESEEVETTEEVKEVEESEEVEITEEVKEVEESEEVETTEGVKEVEESEEVETTEEVKEVEESEEVEVTEEVEEVEESEEVETIEEVKVEENNVTIDLINEIKDGIYNSLENNKENLNNKVNEIIKQINNINTSFDRKIAYDKHKEKIIDNLHRELQVHKEDLYIKMIKPILMDIIQIKDSMEKIELACKTTKKDEITVEKMLKLFNTFSLDLGDILEKYDVEMYREEGNTYKAIRQKVAKYVVTEDKELDKKIAESLTCGYELNGKVISPEKVAIYKVNLD